LILNLSFKSNKDCVAAMVVSEIIERLSPNIEPPSKAPEISGNEAPLLSANVTAMALRLQLLLQSSVAVDRNPAIKKIPKENRLHQ
jgi:hypothetical protein